jgi:hypothetical protein
MIAHERQQWRGARDDSDRVAAGVSIDAEEGMSSHAVLKLGSESAQ